MRGGGLIGRMYSVGMLSNGEVACRLIQLCLHLKGNTKVIKSSCPENGVAHFRIFGVRELFIFTVSKRIRIFVL